MTTTQFKHIFIIGAQKSGTTFLASCLDTIENICVSNPKESHFFTKNYNKGFDYYESLFEDKSAKIRVDASTTYSFLATNTQKHLNQNIGLSTDVPALIYDFAPDALIVYVVRDPIDRMLSAIAHGMRFKGGVPMNVSLQEQINNEPMLDLITRYSEQLDKYKKVFPASQIFLIEFNQLVDNTQETLNNLLQFAGLEQKFDSSFIKSANKHSGYSVNKITGVLVKLISRLGLTRVVNQVVPRFISKRLKRPLETPVVIDKKFIKDSFSKEYVLINNIVKKI